MKLLIISHTEHYYTKDKELLSWGATVTEINHLTKVFDEIYVIGMFYEETPPASALPYTSDKIKFIPVPSMGGHELKDKLRIIKQIPTVVKIVHQSLKKVDCFQLRCPTGIGVFLIPYLNLFVKKPGWFKYAGNWNQEKPPMGYRIQRSLLKRTKRNVTINGKWENQPGQCLTFENPTLFQNNIEEGQKVIAEKSYGNELNFCFVGRLERDKGVERILKAFINIDSERVGKLHLVGDGKEVNYFKELAAQTKIKVIFHGGLPRDKVFEVYKSSHVFLLPSTASEGFPKVIAEAMCFGCIPLVSDVSSITQYVYHEKNGFVINPVTDEELKFRINNIFSLEEVQLRKLLENNTKITSKFTFDYYNNRIKNDIIPFFKSQC